MADSTVNNTPDGFDNAVTVMRQIMGHDGTIGRLARITLTRRGGEAWLIDGQSAGAYLASESDRIDVLRSWAHTLSGELALSESHISDYGSTQHHWRSLTAKATIAGVAVEIWDHIDTYDTTAAEQAPELVAAHA